MFKAMILLSRRDDMTHEEFAGWLIGEHAPRAARLPGVRRLVYNLVEEGRDEAGIDGISELWFDSRQAFEAAYATEIGASVAADSMAHVRARVRTFVTEHPVAGPNPASPDSQVEGSER
jgi:uncharacterized protein (TIGR02118 family)